MRSTILNSEVEVFNDLMKSQVTSGGQFFLLYLPLLTLFSTPSTECFQSSIGFYFKFNSYLFIYLNIFTVNTSLTQEITKELILET